MITYLGWDKPAVDLVAEQLLAGLQKPDTADSFRRATVVVPTAESGRRLRERIAELAGRPVLIPRLILPGQLLPVGETVSDVELTALWLQVLGQENVVERWPHLFHKPLDERDYDELLPETKYGLLLSDMQDLKRMQNQLHVAALTPADVRRCLAEHADQYADVLEVEMTRWNEVEELFSVVDAALVAAGLPTNQQVWQRICAEADAPVARPSLLILACLPQLSQLNRLYLERLLQKGSADVRIWVHAPVALQQRFDAFGCPVAYGDDSWCTCPLEISDSSIHVTADAASMAALTLEMAQQIPNRELTLASADARFTPALSEHFARHGWNVFVPGNRVMLATPLGHILRQLHEAATSVTEGVFPLCSVLRNSTLQQCFSLSGPQVEGFCSLLDTIEQKYMPDSPEMLLKLIQRHAADDAACRDYADAVISLVLQMRETSRLPECLRQLAAWLVRLDDSAAAQISAQLELVATYAEKQGAILANPMVAMTVLQQSVSAMALADEPRDNTHAELQGWLELPYAPGSHLILTGLHEKCVPEAAAVDAYLPESLREYLDLDCTAKRVARDSYLFSSLVQSHKDAVHVILARVAPDDTPVSPSRLLIRFAEGQEAALASRVNHIFAHPESRRQQPEYSRGKWYMGGNETAGLALAEERVEHIAPGRMNPWADGGKSFSPSSVGAFLKNPLAFWLKYVLKLNPDDAYVEGKSSLDALDYGKILHKVLEDTVREIPRLESNLSVRRIEDCALYHLNRTVGQDISLSVRIQKEMAEAKLRQFAALHLEDLRAGWCTNPESGLEAWQDWKLDNQWPFGMKIDRIDINEETGALRVIDYKTGKKPPQEVHLEVLSEESQSLLEQYLPGLKPLLCGEKLYRWADVQLPLYRRCIQEQNPGKEVQCGYYLLPKGNRTVERRIWNINDAEQESALEWCREAIRLIMAGRCLLSASDLGFNSFDDFGCLDVENNLRCMLNLANLI